MKKWIELHKVKFVWAGLGMLLILVFLTPTIFIAIHPGESGVLWRRFGGGTVTVPAGFPLGEEEFRSRLGFDSEGNAEESPSDSGVTYMDYPYSAGLRLKFPWDKIYIYDIRLQNRLVSYDVLAKDGSLMRVNLSIRWKPIEADLGKLHRDIGPDYFETLITPIVGAFLRDEISKYNADELHAEPRMHIQKQTLQGVKNEMEVNFYPVISRESLVLIEEILIREIVLPKQFQENSK